MATALLLAGKGWVGLSGVVLVWMLCRCWGSSPDGCCWGSGRVGHPSLGSRPGPPGPVPRRSCSPGTSLLGLAWKESTVPHPCQPHLLENTFPLLHLAISNELAEAGETSLTGHLRGCPIWVILHDAASSAPGCSRGAGRGKPRAWTLQKGEISPAPSSA